MLNSLFKKKTSNILKEKKTLNFFKVFFSFSVVFNKKVMLVPQRLHVFDEKESSFSEDIVHTSLIMSVSYFCLR